jgi:type II restriction enzyme
MERPNEVTKMRDFDSWFKTFIDNIYDYHYYIDFETVYRNAKEYEYELNLINSLIGKPNQEDEFKKLATAYPSILKCIPTLLAVREMKIDATDDRGHVAYCFDRPNVSLDQYCYFLRETGLFGLFEKHLVRSVPDYVLGVETGLNTNARKNRGGDLMENVVEHHLASLGLKKNQDFFKEFYAEDCERRFGVHLSTLTNNGQATKRFDFVVYHNGRVFGIEANSYGSGGSKLNEVARSYKQLAEESKGIPNFTFVWVTDGAGWKSARNNLKETFDVFANIFNLNDLSTGKLSDLLLK